MITLLLFIVYREIVQLSENGTLALDWSVDDRNDPKKLILILPGLTGIIQYYFIN